MNDDIEKMMSNLGAMASSALQASRIQFACEAASRILAAKIRDQHFITDEDVTTASKYGLLLVDEIGRLCVEQARAPQSASSEPSITPEEIERLHREGKST